MDNIITLNNEFGEEVQFEFLDLVTYEGNEYIVLLSAEDAGEGGEAVILQLDSCDEDAEEETYIGVCDEEVLLAIYSIFKERHKDEFNFTEA